MSEQATTAGPTSADMKVVVPARMASSRLPGKPLADIAGKPMVVHVWQKAVEAVGADNVVVATDHAEIIRAVEAAGGTACLTKKTHESGTDRAAEVADIFVWPDDQIVINLQGDEPMMPADYVRLVGEELLGTPAADMATLSCRIRRREDVLSPHCVKVVTAADQRALYFSRSVIPHQRGARDIDTKAVHYQRHIGLYAYRAAALRRLARLPVCALEATEALEQLRALHAGFHLHVREVDQLPMHGVDTRADLDAVRLRFLP